MMTNPVLRVVVGSGGSKNNIGWLHTEESELNLLKRSDWDEKFTRNSISVVLAEHVWEHLTFEEGIDASKTCYEFLKPGGYVRCAVPDGFFKNEWYQNMVKVGGPGPADHPAASHKIVNTYRTLKSMFEAAGLQVHLLEYCDEKGRFRYIDWDESGGFIYRSRRLERRVRIWRRGRLRVLVL